MNAKERFVKTHKSVLRLNEVKALIMYGCDDWKPLSVHASSEVLDPTANQAIRNVDVIADKLEALRQEETELETFIGESLAIISRVRYGFGEIYANLLEWRYVDGLTWTAIHDDCGIAKSTGYYLLDIAFDWIDSVGVSRLLNGDTEI